MLAVDTNVLIAFVEKQESEVAKIFEQYAFYNRIVLPPVVFSEFLSFPNLPETHRSLIKKFQLMDIAAGYWERTGMMRAKLIAAGLRPKLPDTLIAQNCIDYDIPLLTRDKDFLPFAKYGKLKLMDV